MFLQGTLLGSLPVSFDPDFGGLTRTALDAGSWIDHQNAWVLGADDLFHRTADALPWRQRTDLPMYDNTVDEPRLTWWGRTDDEVVPDVFAAMRTALSARYHEPFDRLGCNLYRDGADSVAWHRDRNRFDQINPLVAIVSLGARRAFRMRPFGGATGVGARTYLLGDGDLFVMGGACQHDWEHTVPKRAGPTGPRLSVMFRSSPAATLH